MNHEQLKEELRKLSSNAIQEIQRYIDNIEVYDLCEDILEEREPIKEVDE